MKKKKHTTEKTMAAYQTCQPINRGSYHFPIILRNEREFITEQQLRWSIKRKNWVQLLRKRTIATKFQNQDSMDEIYNYLTRNIKAA